MLTYKVFIHRDFLLTFDVSASGVACTGGHVFNDHDNPTYYDTGEEAEAAVQAIPFQPILSSKSGRVTLVQDVASAVCVDVDEHGQETGPRKLLLSNLPDMDVLEAFVAKSLK